MSEMPQKHGPEWWVWFRTHVLLMPPGVPLSHSEKKVKKQAAKDAAQREALTGQGAGGLDAWIGKPAEEPAAAPAHRPVRRTSSNAADEDASAGSFAVESEQTLGRALTRVLRVVAIIALVFVVVVGARQIFFPTESTNVVQQVESEQFPAAAGAEVATRQVGAYLTLDPDEAALDQRDAKLALDSESSESSSDTTAGSITGKQSVHDLAVVRVSQIDSTHARALVSGTITDYTKGKKDTWNEGKSRPIAAEVLLVADNTGAVKVSGRPALVSPTPGPVATPVPAKAQQDSATGTDTMPAAESFFSSYGADATVTASVAPGANIAGLHGAATFKQLNGWTVYGSGKDTRSAQATVQWALPSGVELTQTYTLTLSSVSADETGGWQISAISGGGTPQQ